MKEFWFGRWVLRDETYRIHGCGLRIQGKYAVAQNAKSQSEKKEWKEATKAEGKGKTALCGRCCCSCRRRIQQCQCRL